MKAKNLENLLFQIFSEITDFNRIHGDSEEVLEELKQLNKSDKMLQT